MRLHLLVTCIIAGCLPFLSATSIDHNSRVPAAPKKIITGADQLSEYLPYLRGKRVGMLVNQTSIIGNRSSVDSLLSLHINIRTIFGPEHGFRGNASNGAKVSDEVDPKTGIPIVSLYGAKRKPSKQDMDSLDIMIFDLQDVGCRFFTTINTLHDVMDACAEFHKELIILDRPDPNGFVDGPVLDMKLKSGIGRYPIPVTHGMTLGEFAQMLNGEGWLTDKMQCQLKIIPVKNYAHNMDYTLPVGVSPNLNTQQGVVLYPSLCLFEGTYISQGRGTDRPFTVLGAPELKGQFAFSFTPVSIPGKAELPLHQDTACYGIDLFHYSMEPFRKAGKINIRWMMELYQKYPHKEQFFNSKLSKAMGHIDNLAGTTQFKEQIIAGTSEEDIRKSWEPALSQYKEMRKKYLLYP